MILTYRIIVKKCLPVFREALFQSQKKGCKKAMGLPQEFDEDEVRDGFYINGMMKKIWAANLNALDFLNDYCNKHGIRWFMAYGTLLGAVRHQGYIPWDDDCDIWMLRKDFNRLIKLLNNEKDCDFQIRETRIADYDGYIPILTNRIAGASFDTEFLQKNHDVPYATTIDIFVLDYYSRNQADEEWRDNAVRTNVNVSILLKKLVEKGDKPEEPAALTKGKNSNGNIRSKEIGSLPKDVEKDVAKTITIQDLVSGKEDHPPYQKILQELDRLIFLTNHNFCNTEPLLPQIDLVYTGLISYFTEDEADFVKVYPSELYNGIPKLDKNLFNETIELPFEGRMYPAPAAYDTLLHIYYKDYMKRVIGSAAHNYPAFLKYENQLLTSGHPESNPYHFHLEKKELPDPSKKLTAPKTTVTEYLAVLQKLQCVIDQHLIEMNAKTISDVYQNLQKVAIDIGNQIEESRNSEYKCIPSIKEFCNVVYKSFELLVNGELTAEDLRNQQNALQKMQNRIHFDYLNRKEILFLLDRMKNWKAVESLWKIFSKDSSCDVYVMMMPYYYKNADSSLKEEKHIDSANLPPDVHVVSDDFNFLVHHHPDLTFIVNGYDYYNYIRSIAPEYYTQNIWQCTDQLIYIPWFMIDAFKKSDPQWATVPFFAQIPGVVYADRTIVQSEAVRDLYIDAAEDMDETIPRSYWEEKIQGWGSPLTDTEDSFEAAENIYQHLMGAIENTNHNA